MSQLCCTSWGSQFSACLVQDGMLSGDAQSDFDSGTCASPRTPVTYAMVDAGAPACVAGQTPCTVDTTPSCCSQDCSGGPSCLASGAVPSCCHGYCGEMLIPPNTVLPGPMCDSSLAHTFAACCSDSAIVVPQAIGQASPEWALRLGDRIAPAVDASTQTTLADAAAAAPCVPTTCEAEHQTCATISDNCGGHLVCSSDCSKLEQGAGCMLTHGMPTGSGLELLAPLVCLIALRRLWR